MGGTDGIGYLCAGIAIMCFGSNFVVVKAYKTGDGMFFQWILASGILIMGIFTFLIQCSTQCTSDPTIHCSSDANKGCPAFQPLAMLGGMLWATGNLFTVSIIKTIGLSTGMLTWGMVNMLTGWASARFGLLGLEKQPVSNPTLNSVGVVVATLALGVFAFIKPTVGKAAGATRRAPKGGLLDDEHDAAYAGLYASDDALDKLVSVNDGGEGEAEEGGGGDEVSWTDKLTPQQRTIFGFAASAVAGVLYGTNFNPPGYVKDHFSQFHGATSDLKELIFSHFCGIWLSATFYFLGYAALTRNKPIVYAEVALPGVVSGMIWALAQISWFFANDFLGNVIAFPLISIGPGLVSAMWAIFVFRELQGRKNFVLVTLAFVLIATAATMMALSK